MNDTIRALPHPPSGFSAQVSSRQRNRARPAASVVRGRPQVIALGPLLSELSRRTGQAGLMDRLELLVKAPAALRKIPCVVLVGLREGLLPQQARADDVEGAVLLYEYVAAGVPTGVFATDDVNGYRTVVAQAESRAEVAQRAGQILIQDGGVACLITVEQKRGAKSWCPIEPSGWNPWRTGTRVRSKRCDLPLGATLDDTLAAIGKSTRRNLRRYRERAERELGARFEPSVQIGPDEFLELYRNAINPVPEEIAAWRYHFVCASQDRVFSGVRAADGRWLSLIAGTRCGGEARMDWQVNRAGYSRYSLCTVLRSFLVEHEGAMGTRRLLFDGGTSHSIALSLLTAEMLDVIVVRRGIRGTLLRWLARRALPASIFLARALADPTVHWTS